MCSEFVIPILWSILCKIRFYYTRYC